MKTRSIKAAMLLSASFLFFASCEETSKPELQFVFNEKAYSPTKTNLFLTRSFKLSAVRTYDYIITDGVFLGGKDGGGWTMNDFSNATYFIAIETASQLAMEMGSEYYSQLQEWDEPVAARISFFSLKSAKEINGGSTAASLIGNIRNEEKMNLAGMFQFTYYDGKEWVVEKASGEFSARVWVKDAH